MSFSNVRGRPLTGFFGAVAGRISASFFQGLGYVIGRPLTFQGEIQ